MREHSEVFLFGYQEGEIINRCAPPLFRLRPKITCCRNPPNSGLTTEPKHCHFANSSVN